MLVAIAVLHRRGRQRLHGQSQQEQGCSKTADGLGHKKSIALSKIRRAANAALTNFVYFDTLVNA
jgi:hypothetical protein